MKKYHRFNIWFNLGDDFTVMACCHIKTRQEIYVPHFHDGLPF